MFDRSVVNDLAARNGGYDLTTFSGAPEDRDCLRSFHCFHSRKVVSLAMNLMPWIPRVCPS